MAAKLDNEFVWASWNKDKSQDNAVKLLDAFRPMIHREVSRQSGTLPQSFLEVDAKRLTFDAFNTYDPGKGTKLSTHVANRLKGLARSNYTYQSALRMPEEHQRQFGTFMAAKHELDDKFGREASVAELADKLSWSQNEVGKMEKNLHSEVSEFKSPVAGSATAAWTPDDAVIDYLYYDMTPEEKVIFESTTGYKEHPVLSVKELARDLKLSESQVRRRKKKLIAKIEGSLKQS